VDIDEVAVKVAKLTMSAFLKVFWIVVANIIANVIFLLRL